MTLPTPVAPATGLESLFLAWHGARGISPSSVQGRLCLLHRSGVLPHCPPAPSGGAGLAASANSAPVCCPCAGDTHKSAQEGQKTGAGQGWPRGLALTPGSSLPELVTCFPGASTRQVAQAGPLYCFAGNPWAEQRQGVGEPLAICQSLRQRWFQKELLNRGLNKLRKTPAAHCRGLGALEENSLAALVRTRCALAPWPCRMSFTKPPCQGHTPGEADGPVLGGTRASVLSEAPR